ncbi:MAG: N-6 DNA methylase, partial [Acidobacteria bacterium]|nr:N-6 DNA methylase [Acidobacteriota bacterium]
GDSPIPPELETPLHEGGEVLRPDFAVRERDPGTDASPWQLLVRVLEPGEDFDRVTGGAGRLEVSAHGRMERLLRQTGVPAGLLCNGRSLRLVSAPRGESSGWLDLHVADMVTTAGRPIVGALRLLLSETRLLGLPRDERLAALLADSRRFQNEVSERLAEQVLHALYELLRGIQAADDAAHGRLLREALAERPDHVYHALLTVILRLVFLLYAEERDLLPDGETFARHYSLAGLYERLREDAALHPDTMNQRYGAWAQLLVLFRLFHDGAESDGLRLPPRHGELFDPDRFPFLEGRVSGGERRLDERIEPPLVPDGTVYRALDKLLVLDGERISYRALDVEQIGSVYETMMGFRIETATGRSVAIKAQKKQGAPTTADLEALLREPAGKRAQWLRDRTDRALTDTVRRPVAAASTVADLHAALQPVIDAAATPDIVPGGALVLQPSEARRRSGSHYTPRELTEPIVRTALEPILARLRGPGGEPPNPTAILDLKVCDPAMGSGAFLVEACRQLGDALLDAWRFHAAAPPMQAGEDEVIVARRLVAQRCLYGVDRNPMAVDLAKVSLWLATLAKEHPLTFVDHALRRGDSLVGLSQGQIEAFHWDTGAEPLQQGIETIELRKCMARVNELRRRIRDAGHTVSDGDLRNWWSEARIDLARVRLSGDLLIAAFFNGRKPKERETKRIEYAGAIFEGEVERYRGWIDQRRGEEPPLAPFHWEIEFPEVFDRGSSEGRKASGPAPGFDA